MVVKFCCVIQREDMINTLRLLIATDCHLGYMEKDEIRRNDSFESFEEICSIAEEKQVISDACFHLVFV